MLTLDLTGLLRNPETPQYVIADAVQEARGLVAKVYVVYGETGEYSDHSNWVVAGFLDKSHAEAFRDKLNQWCRDHFCLARGSYDWVNKKHIDSGNYDSAKMEEALGIDSRYDAKCPLDPNFSCDYTGTRYDIWEMPLRSDQ